MNHMGSLIWHHSVLFFPIELAWPLSVFWLHQQLTVLKAGKRFRVWGSILRGAEDLCAWRFLEECVPDQRCDFINMTGTLQASSVCSAVVMTCAVTSVRAAQTHAAFLFLHWRRPRHIKPLFRKLEWSRVLFPFFVRFISCKQTPNFYRAK